MGAIIFSVFYSCEDIHDPTYKKGDKVVLLYLNRILFLNYVNPYGGV